MAVMVMAVRDLIAVARFIGTRHQVPYAWGRGANDCVGFAFDAAEAATGIRPAPELDWTSKRSALATIRRLGGLEAGLDRFFERVPAAFALPGDIAAVEDADLGIHPMVVDGVTLVCPGDRGLRRCPRKHMMWAWNIERIR